MTETVARDPNRCPTHPGAFLREIVMPEVDATKVMVARSLGISRQTLYDILNERQPVTPDMAVRLATFFGGSDRSWLNMQAAFDLWHARKRVDVGKIRNIEHTVKIHNKGGALKDYRPDRPTRNLAASALATTKGPTSKKPTGSYGDASVAAAKLTQKTAGKKISGTASAKRKRSTSRKKRG